MLFLLLGSLYGDETTDEGYPAIEMLLAGMLGYGAANTGFAGMAITLVIRREYGILKRIRSTPLPASSYFGAALTSILLVFALQALVLIALGECSTTPGCRSGRSRSPSSSSSAPPRSRGWESAPRR